MKKIIGSFAALASTFIAQHADAKLQNQDVTLPNPSQDAAALNKQMASEKVVVEASGGQYNFLLKRSESTGELHAYHSSHASHASHRSHSSSRY
jgi:hypothetical protein